MFLACFLCAFQSSLPISEDSGLSQAPSSPLSLLPRKQPPPEHWWVSWEGLDPSLMGSLPQNEKGLLS